MTRSSRPVPTSERHDCRVCGTWVCDQCGWRRSHAALLQPEKQFCAHCLSTVGHYVPVRHAHRGIQREHDEDAVRLLGPTV